MKEIIRVNIKDLRLAVRTKPIQDFFGGMLDDMFKEHPAKEGESAFQHAKNAAKGKAIRIALKSFLPTVLNFAAEWLDDFNRQHGTDFPLPDVKAGMQSKDGLITYAANYISGFVLNLGTMQTWQAITSEQGDLTYVDGFAATAPGNVEATAITAGDSVASTATDATTPPGDSREEAREVVTSLAVA